MIKKIALSLTATMFFCLGAGQDARTSGINVSYIDPQVKPCDDFFTYANGSWMKNARIPAEYPVWGNTWEIRDRTWQVLKDILEELTAGGSGVLMVSHLLHDRDRFDRIYELREGTCEQTR